MTDNNLYEKAYTFAVRIVKAYQFLSSEKKEFVISKQLLKKRNQHRCKYCRSKWRDFQS